ncbi:MAG: hypothetical protein QFF03_08820 [Pseudomonadota bacterium]|nr:hypothetical protein [Pseudomonadota bacterium]
MKLTLECTRAADGRWLAQVSQLPGVLAFAPSEVAALAKVQALALRVLADQLETGHAMPDDMSLSIVRTTQGPDADESPLPSTCDRAEYDAWLAAEVQEALDDDAPTVPHDEAMRLIRAAVFAK